MRTVRNALLATVCLSAMVGCCGFHHAWREAECCNYAGGLAGRWEGTWESHVNGHRGKLRAIITPSGDETYEARFFATYHAVLPFEFTVPLTAVEQDGVHAFEGQTDLGWLAGGVYSYAGEADACCFNASYCAEKDHGVFSMSRVD